MAGAWQVCRGAWDRCGGVCVRLLAGVCVRGGLSSGVRVCVYMRVWVGVSPWAW